MAGSSRTVAVAVVALACYRGLPAACVVQCMCRRFNVATPGQSNIGFCPTHACSASAESCLDDPPYPCPLPQPQRVSEVWGQLESEVQQPDLPAVNAPDLLLHMMALQAEGLPVAQVGALGARWRAAPCLHMRRLGCDHA